MSTEKFRSIILERVLACTPSTTLLSKLPSDNILTLNRLETGFTSHWVASAHSAISRNNAQGWYFMSSRQTFAGISSLYSLPAPISASLVHTATAKYSSYTSLPRLPSRSIDSLELKDQVLDSPGQQSIAFHLVIQKRV